MMGPSPRQGTILIIVAGISALMASLAITFLARMRSDLQESEQLMREAQAHIVLVAACHYLQEASRIGYDQGGSATHPEAYGWIDVRDGAVGPKATAIATSIDQPGDRHLLPNHGTDDDSLFPQQSVRRCELFVKEVPPFAIKPEVAPNAIDPSTDGVPWLVELDPKPVITSSFADFSLGQVDSANRSIPKQNTLDRCWFRLLRCGKGANPRLAIYNAATFIVTCGAGQTRGFRSWTEMTQADRQSFSDSQSLFQSLQQNEIRLWYLVEWSPAVGGQFLHNSVHHRSAFQDAEKDSFSINQYSHFPPNASFRGHSKARERNFGGTIRMVQRLVMEPQDW